jgi:N-acetylglutamate synthase-like GNAT family acetyltransferase
MQCIISDCIQLNRFYKDNKDKARAKPSDLMYAVINKGENGDETILAAMRLLPYDGFLFMRSVLTRADARGQGIASELIRFAIAQQEQQDKPLPIYTLPTPLAAPLYARLGFTPVEQNQIPAQLLASYRRFRQSTDGSSVMVLAPRVG